ncbi:MAG: hypothetical protein JST54_09570 [Deltaproteobacteria bacterium]|nr:hypothetical protein [Deltaproteobacteria bacterium]
MAAHRAGGGSTPRALSGEDRSNLVLALVELAKDAMTVLLLACGGVCVVLGDREEAAVLRGLVVFVLGITFSRPGAVACAPALEESWTDRRHP